ncbi:hypothetical protein G3578_07055 [Brevibacillus sp. SYP-B805]|uniref:hypothetical protein n=1 Tax=Brevibacillus sp. SYP-B805 TaxID=1578199 RepID=UPI0013EA091B|nr:hypothetical protein [Brevibacillus sp. SYP-B805]NGQ94942.1 hypothetical protein [Brevibacillus sp. SYP-B805]
MSVLLAVMSPLRLRRGSRLFADPNRLMLSYYVEREDGTRSADYLHGKMYVTDAQGQKLAEWPYRFYKGDEYGYYQFVLSKAAEQAIVHFEISAISSVNHPAKQGKWHVTVPVDMQKAMAATKQLPIGQQFTAEKGLSFDLVKISYSPSAIRLTIGTDWKKEAETRIQNLIRQMKGTNDDRKLLLGNYAFSYRILDQAGNVVVQKEGVDDWLNVISSYSTTDPVDGGRKEFQETFVPIHRENLRFVLDGLTIVEPADLQMSLSGLLKQGSVTQEYEGDTFTAAHLQMKQVGKDRMATLEITGKIKEPHVYQWRLVDSQGRVYESVIQHQEDEEISRLNDNKLWELRQTLSFPDLNNLSGTYTLQLKSIPRWYPTHWEVSLPKIP